MALDSQATRPRARALHAPRRPSYASQTIERALAVLQCFTPTEDRLSAQSIAERLGLSYGTVYRYLVTLEAAGYLQRDPHSGLYRLGLRLVEHAGIVLNQLPIRVHALAELDALADELGLQAHLAVLFEGDAYHIAVAVRGDQPRSHTTLGRRSVAHCTTLGKCLLAGLPREEVHAQIRLKGWRPYTPNSIQSFEALDRELDAVLARGYALDHEERGLGYRAVGAPIRDRTGQIVAAMSVSGRSHEFAGPALDSIVEAVVRHAERVSYRLGHEPAYLAAI